MDQLNADRELIERLLTENASIPFANGQVELELVFDRQRDRYVSILVGRDRGRRVHGCLIHIDLIDGKFVIQRDGTEYSMANELMDAGIPKDRLVLAYGTSELREVSGFAITL